MVKHENFKTCDQSGFCKRNRLYADNAEVSSWTSPYELDPRTITFKNGELSGIILKSIEKRSEKVRLPITISFLESGTARVTVDEEKRQKGDIVLRHDSKARKERYNEAGAWALVGGLAPSAGAALSGEAKQGTTSVKYGPAGTFEAVIGHAPFRIEFKRDGVTQIQLNERGLLNMEHWRPKVDKAAAPEAKEGEALPAPAPPKDENEVDESTWWEESFGGNTDTKPRGPESIGLDISFPGYDHVYGIPEHASSLSLKTTRGGDGNYKEPYRLYNSDVFEYELDSPMTLYGAIPFMQAHRKDSTVGVFWLNAAETWVDIVKSKTAANKLSLGIAGTSSTQTHWISESGLIDVFVFLGPTPKDVVHSYGELTGYTQLPQEFAIAHHQCRWNYVTDEDVIDVNKKFNKHNIPMDVLWLDIEYTEYKKYFTWDPLTFDDPENMHKQVAKSGRKMVTIIDPHIKIADGYHVVEELKKKQFGVKNKDGDIYEGHCWPGQSHWVDAFNPLTINWWKGLFQYANFKGTGPNTFIWNDMNEPSVFNGPETTMPKDNLHHGNWEHRDVHNLNGMTFHNATYQALLSRSKAEEKSPRRPFVLTRAFYSGSQRSSAMWTGDNLAEWPALAASIPMVLNQGISGYPFAGADVGGFFGNPSKELLTRWYQAGAFYPFFRAHAHIDTRRREPYLAGDPYMGIITDALRLRYALLPTWYTAFHEASVTGAPIVRPNFYVHPEDEAGFAIDDQMYLADTGLLTKPVVTEGAESVDIYLGDDKVYYDYFDYSIYKGKGSHTIKAPLDKITLLMQEGHIFPRRDRQRRSSALMKFDPYTLVVVLGPDGKGQGELYIDDGESFDYESGAYIHRKFIFENGILRSEDIGKKGKLTGQYVKKMDAVRVERVIVVGGPGEWKGKSKVKVSREGKEVKNVEMKFVEGKSGKGSEVVVRDPNCKIGEGWSISFV
ncbi:putative alpha glucosidase II, alpha subunit [Tothia fuscella]|uniref:alpha-glucosidase n=1 Tax=Tothia fuscella TaxID=1048955 RepID=A0A9P4P3V8_9PEZI|nr:putative alpha glucosidase II, alpha subunit [Tothia fuscella]